MKNIREIIIRLISCSMIITFVLLANCVEVFADDGWNEAHTQYFVDGEAVASQVRTIDGVKYGFDENGYLIVNAVTVFSDGEDSYVSDDEGIAYQINTTEGWIDFDTCRFYVKNGEVLGYIKKIGEDYILFTKEETESGFALIHQQGHQSFEISSLIFHVKDDGTLYVNELFGSLIGDEPCYYHGDWGFPAYGPILINEKEYLFGYDGKLVKFSNVFWASNGKRYVSDDEGVAYETDLVFDNGIWGTGWLKSENCYLCINGLKPTGVIKKRGDKYYAFKQEQDSDNLDGPIYQVAGSTTFSIGTDTINRKYFRTKSDGSLYVNKWYGYGLSGNNKQYYYGEWGMAPDENSIQTIDGNDYLFGEGGKVKTYSVIDWNDKTYASDADGIVHEISGEEGWNISGDYNFCVKYTKSGDDTIKSIEGYIHRTGEEYSAFGGSEPETDIIKIGSYYFRKKTDNTLYVSEWYEDEISGDTYYYGEWGIAPANNSLYTLDGNEYLFLYKGRLNENSRYVVRLDGKYYASDDEGIAYEITDEDGWNESGNCKFLVSTYENNHFSDYIEGYIKKTGDKYIGFKYISSESRIVRQLAGEFSLITATTNKSFRTKSDGTLYVNEWYKDENYQMYYYGAWGMAANDESIYTIEDKDYIFDSDGALLRNTHSVKNINGYNYVADDEGFAYRINAYEGWNDSGDCKFYVYYEYPDYKYIYGYIKKDGDKYSCYSYNQTGYDYEIRKVINKQVRFPGTNDNDFIDYYLYANEDGDLYVNSWRTVSETEKYYYGDWGIAPWAGLSVIGDNTYLFDDQGKASVCEIFNEDGDLYYSDGDGYVHEASDGWLDLNDKTYYIENGLVIKAQLKEIDGEYYYFEPTKGYIYISKWLDTEEGRRYFDENGHMLKNTVAQIGEVKYMFAENGTLLADSIMIVDGKEYESNGDGVAIEKCYHNMTHVARKEATCQADGNIEYWSCDKCEKYYADEDGKNEIDESEIKLNKLDHTPAEAVRENETAPTCSSTGGYDEVVYCSVCHEELSRESYTVDIDEDAHVPSETPVILDYSDSTCAQEGSYVEKIVCSECGEEISRETKSIAKKDHTPADAVRENVIEATCATEGSYDEVVYCSDCHEELSNEHKTIEKTNDHVPGEPVKENIIEPIDDDTPGTCEEVVYCTVCNKELSREEKEYVIIYKYNVKVVIPSAGGRVNVSNLNPAVGEIVTYEIVPFTGYELNSFVIKDKDGNVLETANDSFEMPEGDVTIRAAFKIDEYAIERWNDAHTQYLIDGEPVTSQVKTIDGLKYGFDDNGYLIINAVTVFSDGINSYASDEEGVAHRLKGTDGWITSGNYKFSVIGDEIYGYIKKEDDGYIGYTRESVGSDYYLSRQYGDSSYNTEFYISCLSCDPYNQSIRCFKVKQDGTLYANEWCGSISNEDRHYYGEWGMAPYYNSVFTINGTDYLFDEYGRLANATKRVIYDKATQLYYASDDEGIAHVITRNSYDGWEVSDDCCFSITGDQVNGFIRKEESCYKGYVYESYSTTLINAKYVADMYGEFGINCLGCDPYNQSIRCFKVKQDGTLYVNEWCGSISNEDRHYYGDWGMAPYDNSVFTINDKEYLFDYSGHLNVASAEAIIDNGSGKSYISDDEGLAYEMREGWNVCNGKTYYVEGSTVVKGELKEIDDELYYFDPTSGYMYTNKWLTTDDGKYYFDAEGHIVRSTVIKIGYLYYMFGADGFPSANATMVVDGVIYVSDEDGIATVKNVHTMKHVDREEPTCQKTGHIEYWACERCERIFADEEAENELSYSDIKIDKLDHTPGEAVRENEVAPTCTKAGLYDEAVYCTVCNEELSRETHTIEKDEDAHTPMDEPVRIGVRDATCAHEGSYMELIICRECGSILSRETKSIDKTEHIPADAVKENETEATCGEDGSYDEVVYCANCHEELSRENRVIEKTNDHTPGAPVIENIIESTDDTPGTCEKVVYCTVCHAELSREEVEYIPEEKEKYNVNVVISSAGGNVQVDKSRAQEGETVSYEIIPNDGYELKSFVIKDSDGNEIGSADDSFEMPACEVTIRASFIRIIVDYSIETNSNREDCTVTVDSYTANENDMITVITDACEGYELTGLVVLDSEDNEIEVSEGKFTMPASNVRVNATFEQIVPKFDITIDSRMTGGSIVASKDKAIQGEEITLTVITGEGFTLEADSLEVRTDGNDIISVTDNTFVMPEDNVTVTAVFTASEHSITISDTENGSIDCILSAETGEAVKIMITEDIGYALNELTVTDKAGSPIAVVNRTFIMPPSDVTIAASFISMDPCVVAVYRYDKAGNDIAVDITGTGTYDYGETVTLYAPKVDGYNFIGWYRHSDVAPYHTGDVLCATNTYNFKNVEDGEYTAVYEVLGNVNLTINGGSSYEINGRSKSTEVTASYALGSRITLYAYGNGFAYWKNSYGKVLSRSAEYTFTVVSGDIISAVFNTVVDDKAIIVFETAYDQVLARDQLSQGETMDIPAIPPRNGYNILGWDYDGDGTYNPASDILENAIIRGLDEGNESHVAIIHPVYERKADVFEIVINGGSGSGEYQQDVQVNVRLDTSQIPPGQKFSHWADDEGNIRSYNENFSFFVEGAETLTAVYVDNDTAVEVKGTVVLTSITREEDNKMSVVTVSNVPTGCVIEMAGLVATDDATVGNSGDGFNADTAKYTRGRSYSGTDYQYTWVKGNVHTGDTWYIRPYLVYTDSDNNVYTVYGNMVSFTY